MYYTIKQAAELLSVHPNTIRNWIRAGQLPATKFSERTIRIKPEDLNTIKETK